MSPAFRRIVIALVAVALVVAALVRPRSGGDAPASPSDTVSVNDTASPNDTAAGVPRLVELGSDRCENCKAMQVVLDRLRVACAGRLAVEFIDIWKDEERAAKYAVLTIPTQVFVDPAGRELARHEGYYGFDEILARWRQLGHDVAGPGAAAGAAGAATADFRASLVRTIEGARGWALAAAFVWGVLSIVLSPCHLASIPLVVAVLAGSQGGASSDAGPRRALTVSTLFSVGILVSLVVAGAVAVAAGTLAGDVGPWPAYAVSAVVAVVGLQQIGAIDLAWAGPRLDRFRGGGTWAALALGVVFGLALGPCAFAFVAPLLVAAFQAARSDAVFAAGMLALFAVGHCAAIVAGATSLDRAQRAVTWGASRTATAMRVAFGVLLLVFSVYLSHTAA